MQYLTREELEDITTKLIENPTRETLKSLSNQYNTTEEVSMPVMEDMNVQPKTVEASPLTETTTAIPEPVIITNEVEVKVPEMVNTYQSAVPNIAEVPSFSMPTVEVPTVETLPINNGNSMEIPSFEVPKVEAPLFNGQISAPINFDGNLWGEPKQEVPNLMQTTDNFNMPTNVVPSTEVPVAPQPFFVPSVETTANPIPVGGPINNMEMPQQEPSMFGQFEQSFM